MLILKLLKSKIGLLIDNQKVTLTCPQDVVFLLHIFLIGLYWLKLEGGQGLVYTPGPADWVLKV